MGPYELDGLETNKKLARLREEIEKETMPTTTIRKMTVKEKQTLIQALRVAANVYRNDAAEFRKPSASQNLRLAEQFDRQAADAEALADWEESEGGAY